MLYNPRMSSSDPEREVPAAPHRKVIHIDMYAFYASLSRRKVGCCSTAARCWRTLIAAELVFGVSSSKGGLG